MMLWDKLRLDFEHYKKAVEGGNRLSTKKISAGRYAVRRPTLVGSAPRRGTLNGVMLRADESSNIRIGK